MKAHAPIVLAYSIAVLPFAFVASARAAASGTTQPTQVRTIPPNLESPIAVDTPPSTTCSLTPNSSGADAPLQLYSEKAGGVLFFVRPGPDISTLNYSLECQQPGGSYITYPIQVTVSAAATVLSPQATVAQYVPAAAAPRAIRPALTGADVNLPNQELTARGYPLRPDPKVSPGLYDAWLRAVSSPMAIGPQETTATTQEVPGPPQEANNGGTWSGYEIDPAANSNIYIGIQGVWTVPSVTADTSQSSQCYSSLWVGLDGDQDINNWYTNDGVVQAGTEQDASYDSSTHSTTTAYYNWFEWTPNGIVTTGMTSHYPVYPNDDMFVTVWVTNSSGDLVAPSTGEVSAGWADIEDLTQSTDSYEHNYTIPTGKEYGGYSLEWILEVPLFSGTDELAKYGTAQMSSCAVVDANYNWYNMADESPNSLSSYGTTGHTLSSATQDPSNANEIDFAWSNFE